MRVLLMIVTLALAAPAFAATSDSPAPTLAATPSVAHRTAPVTESVTVTGFKSREVLDKLVKSFVTPTKLTGKIARWENGICPLTTGQPSRLATLVTQRVKEVATAVGSPVSKLESCTPNIEIVFTTTPQALLDNVSKDDPDYLGYATTSAQREALATVTRPIQAWYTTETIDVNGMRRIDSGRRLGTGITMSNFSALPCPSCLAANRDPIYLPDATYARVTGNRINDGLRSGFNHIIIAVDSSKLVGREFGPLTDYIAMLSLTQLNSLDTCQPVPSIVNLMAIDCDQKVDGMTQTDLAYLHGLYQMGSDKSLLFQQNDIADVMTDTLGKGSRLAAAHMAPAPDVGPTRCDAPDQPSTIDGATASLDQLKASITAAKEYMAASNSYQDCLDKEINAQRAAATPQRPFDKAIADRNLALASVNQKMKENIGASVNAAIATFKKAHPAE